MPKAGPFVSLWSPLASSATPIDSDGTADEPDKHKTSPRPVRTSRPIHILSAKQSSYRKPSYDHRDFYKRYSEHWERSYDSASTTDDATCFTDDDEDGGGESAGLFEEGRAMVSSWSGQPQIKGRTECE